MSALEIDVLIGWMEGDIVLRTRIEGPGSQQTELESQPQLLNREKGPSKRHHRNFCNDGLLAGLHRDAPVVVRISCYSHL